MPDSSTTTPILELRVSLTSADFERLLKFYRDGLGLEPAADWSGDLGRAVLLEMGNGTLEVFDEQQAESVDRIEVGKRISGPVRLALRVPDLQAAVDRLIAHGAVLVHPPVVTPWGDLNARVQDPDGLQVTLFQVRDERS